MNDWIDEMSYEMSYRGHEEVIATLQAHGIPVFVETFERLARKGPVC